MAKRKKKFSKSQLNRISEILGSISVAWFTAGAITPIFNGVELIQVITALTATGFFVWFSLVFAKKVK